MIVWGRDDWGLYMEWNGLGFGGKKVKDHAALPFCADADNQKQKGGGERTKKRMMQREREPTERTYVCVGGWVGGDGSGCAKGKEKIKPGRKARQHETKEVTTVTYYYKVLTLESCLFSSLSAPARSKCVQWDMGHTQM